nr:type I-U CRISPR-associated protein Cas7 [Klugiella xanthotipulae]
MASETVFQPLGGPNTPVAPPTYARQKGDDSKAPNYAMSQNAFVPKRDADGWYTQIEHNNEGTPRTAMRVLLDSWGSQSGRAETAIWNNQDRLGITVPALVVSGIPEGKQPELFDNATLDEQFMAALNVNVSTWELSHRHVDGWIRFATEDGTTQVWQSEDPDSLKALICSASAQRAETLFKYFPNSAIYGFWLSSGSAMRHKLPRAYSSEIVGYGAREVVAGATKLDAAGGASKQSRAENVRNALTVLAPGKRGGKEPSTFGLGQVPSQPEVRGFMCETILQQSSISFAVLRSLRFDNEERRVAALTVLVLLAMAGHALAQEETFLRSECALVAEETRWGWKRQGSGATPEAVEIDGVNDIAEALREALSDAEKVGLSFAAPIRLNFSEAQQKLIAERVEAEVTKQETSE